MKIYFCDICNQSIPIKDLDDGLAVAVKGKLICAACNTAAASATKTATASTAAPASGGSTARDVGLVVVAAALGAGGAWFLVHDSQKKLEARLMSQLSDAVSKGSDSGTRIAGVASDLDAARRSIDALKKQIEDEALEDAARRQHDQAGVEARIENIKKYMRESETLKERVQELEVRSAAAADSNGSVQRDVAALRGQIGELVANIGKIATPGPASQPVKTNEEASPPVANANPTLPPLPKDLQDVAKNLKSGEPGLRFDAVEQLGKSRDPRVVPYVAGALGDSDDFVRRVAAEVLGDLNAKTAIPLLIDGLMDEQLHVRQAVIGALRKVSGQNIKYDEYGKKEERVKQQRLWKTWWDQNQEKILQN